MSLTNKKNNKSLKNSLDNNKNIQNIENEFLIKRKKYKIFNHNDNYVRRTLFLNNNKLDIKEKDENSNKEFEPIITSNNFINRKKDYILHSAKKLKRKYLDSKLINRNFNNDIFNENIFNFRPETERNEKIDMSERGFMRKIDLEIKNLINNQNKSKRSKTAKMNNNRIDKNLNDMENNLNEFEIFFEKFISSVKYFNFFKENLD